MCDCSVPTTGEEDSALSPKGDGEHGRVWSRGVTRSDLSLTKITLTAVCWVELIREGSHCLGVEEDKRWFGPFLGLKGVNPRDALGGGAAGGWSGGILPWGQAEWSGDVGGKDSMVWGSPQRRTPTLGETRKGGSHPLTSLGIPTTSSTGRAE